MYSGPTMVNEALQRAARNPSKRPKLPVVRYSRNGPGSLHCDTISHCPTTKIYDTRSKTGWALSQLSSTMRGNGITYVAESVSIVFRVATAHGDEGEAEQHDAKDEFASGEPEFSLAISSDSDHVEAPGRSMLVLGYDQGWRTGNDCGRLTHRARCTRSRRRQQGYRRARRTEQCSGQ